jgi:Homeodomain-like domain
MPRPYSMDLRERVIEAIAAGASRRETAEQFGLSASVVIIWAQRYHATGNIAPKPSGGSVSPLEGVGLERFSHTIFSTKRGFAKRFVDVLRTSFRVAPRDAGLLESLPVLRAQRKKGAPVGLRIMPRGDAMRRRVSGGRSASVCRGHEARGGQSPDGRHRTG